MDSPIPHALPPFKKAKFHAYEAALVNIRAKA